MRNSEYRGAIGGLGISSFQRFRGRNQWRETGAFNIIPAGFILMADVILFVIAALALVLAVIALLVIWRKRQQGKPVETDYYTLFVMGMIFLPVGLVLMITLDLGYGGIAGLGAIYIIAGWLRRDQWKNRRRK
jgi:uncharacterized iron-regulated membrane protein